MKPIRIYLNTAEQEIILDCLEYMEDTYAAADEDDKRADLCVRLREKIEKRLKK